MAAFLRSSSPSFWITQSSQSARLNSMCNDVLLEYYRTLGKNRLEGNDAFQDPFRLAGPGQGPAVGSLSERIRDRKSTRLNSSHTVISYAVFCLKKKKKKQA